MKWLDHLSLLLLGISSLFPLINPIGTALIINPYFAGSSLPERKSYALTISFYCLGLGLVTLFLGSWCLKAMGISIPTTQMAGGLIIGRIGLSLLNSPAEPKADTSGRRDVKDSLFFPLAFPLTLGPGAISVLITLSAHAHAENLSDTFLHMGVLGASLLVVIIMTFFCFSYSDVVLHRVGPSGSLVINRLMAFLVFCVGIQMLAIGLKHSFPHLFY